MICQRCKKREATRNFTEYVGGERCELHLCAQCAYEAFGEFEQNVQNASLYGLFGDGEREEKVCPSCGLRFSDYEKTGLLGCPSCYDLFKEELLPYIARIQGKTVHVGKSGGVFTTEHDELIQLSALQDKMEAALGRGDYAEAGRINARMNAIKKRAGGKDV